MAQDTQATAAKPKELPAALSLAIDFGPAVVFFAAYRMDGIMTATIAVTVAAVVAALISRVLTGSVSLALIITTGIAIVFGGLTIAFNDERFVKIKPTIINALLGLILLGGLPFKRPLLKPVLAPRFPPMEDAGWFKLSRNFGLFFLLQAVLNEAVWRTFSTDTWVAYSVWGDVLLTVAFTATQLPLLNRYMTEKPSAAEATELIPPTG